MFPILSHYSCSLPEMPPPELLLLSLSTAAWIAAIGLWSLKSLGSRSHVISSKPTVGPAESIPPDPMPAPPPVASAAPAPARPIETCHVEGGALGCQRSRFMMSFACDDADEAESGEGGVSSWEVTGPRWMGVRGDLGWYRYQDRTAIDGCVVRLWDFNGGLTAGARRGTDELAAGWGREPYFVKKCKYMN